MRRPPATWTTLWTRLGFQRKRVRRKAKHLDRRNHIESLEVRNMLSANDPLLTDFVAFGQDKLDLDKNSVVTAGLLGSNDKLHIDKDATTRGLAAGGKLELHKDVRVRGDVIADGEISVEKDAIIDGDLQSNTKIKLDKNVFVDGDVTSSGKVDLKKNVVISGALSEFGTPELFTPIVLPTATNFSTDSSNDIETEKNETTTLVPGRYGKLELDKDNTLNFSAGSYFFDEIDADDRLAFNLDVSGGNIEIFVAGRTTFDKELDVTVIGGDASDIYLESHDRFKLDKDGEWWGTIFAPDDPIELKKNTTLIGAAYSGKEVQIDANSVLELVAADRLVGSTDTDPPLLTASLSNDTGDSGSDGITFDAGLQGSVTDVSGVEQLLLTIVSVNGGTPAGPFDVTSSIHATDGSFALGQSALEGLLGQALPDGEYTATFTATDTLGNSASQNVSFLLDTLVSSVINLTAPPAGLVTNTNVSISGQITDPQAVTVLEARVGSGPFVSVPFDVAGDFSFNSTLPLDGSADGLHTIQLQLVDTAGNVSALFSRDFTLDTLITTPVILDYAQDTGVSDSDGITSDTRLVFSGIGEAHSTVTISEVSLGTVGSAVVDSSGQWTVDATSVILVDSAYSFTATTEDLAGNISAASLAVAVQVDTEAPAIAFHAPGDGVVTNANPTFSGVVTDPVGITLLEVQIDSGVFLPIDLNESNQFSFTTDFPLDGTADGSHTVRLRATDVAGNVTDILDLVEQTFELDTQISTLNFDLAASSDSSPVGDATTIFSLVTLAGTTDPDLVVELLATGATTTSDASGNFTFENVALALGANIFTLQATDLVGNTSQATRTITRVPDDAVATLIEGSSFAVESSVLVDLGQAAGSRTLRFEVDAYFDTSTSAAVEDTFLVYLVDPTDPTRTLLDRGEPGTALFSLSGDHTDADLGLVRFDGSTVEIDVTSLAAETEGRLVFQLLNQDSDVGTWVAVRELTSLVDPEGVASLAFPTTTSVVSPGNSVDLGSYSPVADIDVQFSNTRFDAAAGIYTAEMRLQNQGTASGRNLAVVFADLPATVSLTNLSGTDDNGAPYVNVKQAIPAGGLLPGDFSNFVRVEFANPNAVPFALQPTVLSAGVNQAPIFDPVGPLTVLPGGHLEIPLSATDPDGDFVTFSLQSDVPLPTGILQSNGLLAFTPAPGEEGSYTFTLLASDGGIQVPQAVTLDVVADPITTTRISGTVLDIDGTPLPNVPISLSRLTVLTDAAGNFTLELPSHLLPTEEFDIAVPTGDIYFDPFGTGEENIDFRRARYDTSTGTSAANPRRHPNLVTSFLDTSMAYGSDDERALALRVLDGSGKLKTSPGDLLPLNNTDYFPDGPLENDAAGPSDPTEMFVAGDVRASENPGLASLHTILLREHNRLADEIASADPNLTGDEIYNRARHKVSAIVQYITYHEYLPLLLGPDALSPYAGYQPGLEPGVGSFFATAAFRFGHSQAQTEIARRDDSGALLDPISMRESFFNTALIQTEGVDAILRGIASQVSEEIDTQVIDGLRNTLFGPPGSGGLDLPAMSIQRGRDLGLPSYNQARIDLGLPPINSFAEITSNPQVQNDLQNTYGTVDAIDAFVGGLAEDTVPGALVGELFHAAIVRQFELTRDADRFWYENGQFTDTELTEIRSTTLSALIHRNSGITNLPTHVFTTGIAPASPAPAGTSAGGPASEFRTLDGSGNNASNPHWGQTGSHLLIDTSLNYVDGISQPNGSGRPGAREVSNGTLNQTAPVPSSAGATTMFVFWGQLLAHDLSQTPTGTSDVLKVHGDAQEIAGNSYPVVAEKLDLLLGHSVYESVNNVIARPIYLPALDLANAVTIDPLADTTVTTAAIPDLEVFVAAGTLQDAAGEMFTGELSVTQVPPDLTPAALPPNLFPDLVVTIQPGEMVFTEPAPITFPNTAGYAPGTFLDLWSIDPLTGLFEIVGQMEVSPDGTVIETFSGGIRNSSWHLPARPEPAAEANDDANEDNDCPECKAKAGNFEVELHSGAVLDNHTLVSYQSIDQAQGFSLHYDSLRADPRPIVHVNYSNLRPNEDQRLVASLDFMRGDFQFTVPGFEGDLGGLQGGEHFWKLDVTGTGRVALQADFTMVPSGNYTYNLTSGPLQFDGERFTGTTTTQIKELRVVNTIDSPFGSGWGLTGLWEIVENLDGSVLLIDGDGSELFFRGPTNPGDPLVSPPGDFSILVKLQDGTYQRTMTDQTVYRFNTNHQIESMTNRNGNVWTYEYNASGIIAKITDPTGLETRFASSNGRVESITDPANRVTTLEYDSAGNLIRITDPDQTSRQWGYDASHRMTSHTDKRGFTEQVFYDFAGRAERSIRKDGTTQFYDPVQTQVLRPFDETTDPFDPPSVSDITKIIGRYADPNGNVTETVLDKQGQAVVSTDGEGRMASVARNEQNLITTSRDGRGYATTYSYDALGNVTSISDQVPRNAFSVPPQIDSPGDPTIRPNIEFTTNDLGANDDESSSFIDLGFEVNFFGTIYSGLYVNNNGNVTFDFPLEEYTPFDLLSTSQVIIAPYFADVDTYSGNTVTFGSGTVADRPAFGVNWPGVGHYDENTNKLNEFQLVIIDRSDIGVGDFDFELNYGQIQWEAGDASGGNEGLGGTSARVGFSNGFDVAFELPGSAVNGAFLDDNLDFGLIHQSRNSILDGRYRFEVRSGAVDIVATQTFTYDPVFNQLTSRIDELGRVTLFEIDPTNGNVLSETRVVGQVDSPTNGEADDLLTTFTYTTYGLIDTMTDPLGRVTDYDYDTFARLTRITYAAGTSEEAFVQYEYDLAGNNTAMVDELGHRTEYTYDDLNRVTQVVEADPDGSGGPLASPVTTTQYDTYGNVLSVTDALNNTTSYTYDAQYRITSVTDAHDETITYSYDNFGNLVSTTDRLGRKTRYVYDDRNRLVETINPEDGHRFLSYDLDDNLTQEVDENGNATSYTYDARNRLTSTIDALGGVMTYEYDRADNLIAMTDELERRSTFEYDEIDREVKRILPDPDQDGPDTSPTFQYVYDKASNLRFVTDALGNTTEYQFDNRDRLIGQVAPDPDGAGPLLSPTTLFEYDDANRLARVIDPLARETSYTYDDLNRLIVEAYPDPDGSGPLAAPVMTYTYDALGNELSMTDALGNLTEYEYDDLYRLVVLREQDPDGTGPASSPVTSYTYDAEDQLVSASDPLARTTNYTYDLLGRLIQITQPDPDGAGPLASPIMTYTYDAVGNELSMTDPVDNVTQYEYDALYRLTRQIDEDLDGPTGPLSNPITIFTYDAVDNLLSLTDPENNVTTYEHDDLDRMITETIELGAGNFKSRSYVYDLMDNLTAHVDRNGRTIQYEYDNLYRMTAERWLDGVGTEIHTIEQDYDIASQMLRTEDLTLGSRYDYTYDDLGRVTQTVIANGGPSVVFNDTYNANSLRTSMAAQVDGVADFLTSFQYDGLNRVSRIDQQGQAGGTAVAAKRVDIGYNADDQFTTLNRYSDLGAANLVASTSYGYDDIGRLTNLTHSNSTTNLTDYTWAFDAASRITQYVNSVDGTSNYTYDNGNQVTDATYDYQSGEAYEYDENGNRTNTGYQTGFHNRLTSDGTYNYEYDAEGNRTKRTNIATGEVTEYEWDHRNRLAKVTDRASDGGAITQVVSHRYDTYNRWISKTVDVDGDGDGPQAGETTRYEYDGNQIVLAIDEAGNVTNRYLWGPAVDQLFADEQADGEVLWALTDHLGTVRDLVDSTGTVRNHLTYDAFGNVTSETDAAIDELFGYTGRAFDEATGLQNNLHRWYDAATGRWASEDPIGFDAEDANLYRYVGNEITRLSDPLGLQQVSGWQSPIFGNPTYVGARPIVQPVGSLNPGTVGVEAVPPGQVEIDWKRPVTWRYRDEDGKIIDTRTEWQEATSPAPKRGGPYFYLGVTPTWGPKGSPVQGGLGYFEMLPDDEARCRGTKPPTFPPPKPPTIPPNPPTPSPSFWELIF